MTPRPDPSPPSPPSSAPGAGPAPIPTRLPAPAPPATSAPGASAAGAGSPVGGGTAQAPSSCAMFEQLWRLESERAFFRAGPPQWACTVHWKVLPHPGPSDSAHMVPPIASQSRWEMARPRPEPPYLRVGESSTCEKERNSRRRPSREIPMPVSLTLKCTR